MVVVSLNDVLFVDWMPSPPSDWPLNRTALRFVDRLAGGALERRSIVIVLFWLEAKAAEDAGG